jgi:hypothetical protein
MRPEPLPLRSVEIEITPKPSPEEREAILRALEQARRERAESAWWRSGLEEDLAESEP